MKDAVLIERSIFLTFFENKCFKTCILIRNCVPSYCAYEKSILLINFLNVKK